MVFKANLQHLVQKIHFQEFSRPASQYIGHACFIKTQKLLEISQKYNLLYRQTFWEKAFNNRLKTFITQILR